MRSNTAEDPEGERPSQLVALDRALVESGAQLLGEYLEERYALAWLGEPDTDRPLVLDHIEFDEAMDLEANGDHPSDVVYTATSKATLRGSRLDTPTLEQAIEEGRPEVEDDEHEILVQFELNVSGDGHVDTLDVKECPYI